MNEIALIYARADGEEAAARLRRLLELLGQNVVDEPSPPSTALVLLTPSALTDPSVVQHLRGQSPTIPQPVPDPKAFPTAIDLATILGALNQGTTSGSKFVVGHAENSIVGDHGVLINNASGAPPSAELASLVAALKKVQGQAPITDNELRTLMARIDRRLDSVGNQLQHLHEEVLIRFEHLDQGQRFTLRTILTRLDVQETRLLDAVLEAIDLNVMAADELDQHLSVIRYALTELNHHHAQIEDRQLAAAAAEIAEIVAAPGLDIKHKLKVSIPIIPLILDYEGEVELNGQINLEEMWKSFRQRFFNRR